MALNERSPDAAVIARSGGRLAAAHRCPRAFSVLADEIRQQAPRAEQRAAAAGGVCGRRAAGSEGSHGCAVRCKLSLELISYFIVPRKPGQHLSIGINPRLRAPDPPPTKTGPTAIHPGESKASNVGLSQRVSIIGETCLNSLNRPRTAVCQCERALLNVERPPRI